MEFGKNRHIFLVQTNATPGDDAEYNDWFTHTHLDEVLTVPGFVAVQRFELNPARRSDDQPDYEYRYIAIAEIEGDPDEALAALAKARENFAISPAMQERRQTYVFTPITPRRVGPE
jgi:hypothetical protein